MEAEREVWEVLSREKRDEIQVEGMLAVRRLLFDSLMNFDKPRNILLPTPQYSRKL